MDTSKEYILMCEKAEEIQKLWKPAFADYLQSMQGAIEIITKAKEKLNSKTKAYPEYLLGMTFGKGGECSWKGYKKLKGCNCIWLPRQDQLQGMVKGIYEFKLCAEYQMVYHFQKFTKKCKFTDWSMEQLWLAFVMKEKYQKTWESENWVKKS